MEGGFGARVERRTEAGKGDGDGDRDGGETWRAWVVATVGGEYCGVFSKTVSKKSGRFWLGSRLACRGSE